MKCPKCHFENPDDSSFCNKCGTQILPTKGIRVTETLETPKEELTTGSTFASRYQIIEELGKGGMGKVYKALDTEIKEKVALKLIKPEIAADKKTIERFRNELKYARKIRHENVCQMYDLGTHKDSYFITMEYVPGEDLKSFIRRSGQLTVGKSLSIAKQVCEGLSNAHKLGVVHRDLKPGNIMIDKEGNARIMDFGIAQSLESKGITGAGVMIGTPEYMSPEQAEVKEVDQRSDIYSLGVILYEMVTGRVPFEGETPLGIAMKHKSEIPKDPKELNAQVPSDLSRVILRCLEKNKEDRYQNAGEVFSELDSIEKGIPTTEREIPKRKPITSREITVTLGLKKLLIPALIVVALVIMVIVIWRPWSKKVAFPIPSGKPSLAVMYFNNNTGDDNLDFWRSALSDSIITDLSQSKYIRVLSIDQRYSILEELNLLEARNYTTEDLKTVAAKGSVNHILQGNLSKAGENFRIDYTLQEINTGDTLGSARMQGRGEESIFTMVDELTIKIKENFSLSRDQITSDVDKDVRNITTSSPEALKYYSEGLKYKWKGEWRKSIPLFEKAVALDPEFAMAYRYLAFHIPEKRQMFMQKAFELSDRISDRERYQIQGDYYSLSEKTYEQAIAAYENLLQLYPDDLRGCVALGNIYMELEQWDKAVGLYGVGIQNKVENFVPYVNQADTYAALGLYDKSIELLKNYLNSFPDNKWIHIYLYGMYLIQGKYDLALIEADKVFSLDPSSDIHLRKGMIFYLRGDFIKAKKEYQKYLSINGPYGSSMNRSLSRLYVIQGRFDESKTYLTKVIEQEKEPGATGMRLQLASTHLKTGNPEEALKESEKALDSAVVSENLDYQRRALLHKGLACIEIGSMEKAQKTAEELKEIIEKGIMEKKIRLYQYLMGKIELKRGNYPKAIEYLKEAKSLLPFQRGYTVINLHAMYIEALALTYYKSGDLDKSQEEYESIISLTTGRIVHGDIYAKSFYLLGKIHEQQGDTTKAIEHYEKFLHLWKDADPGIAEVEDAKKRLAKLKDY